MNLILSFFFGILASISALFIELIFSLFVSGPEKLGNVFFTQITIFMILAVFIEETLKLIFIRKNIETLAIPRENKTMTASSLRIIAYSSLMLGAGFSFIEFSFSFYNFSSYQNFAVFISAIIGVILMHMLTSLAIGLLISNSRRENFSSIIIAVSFSFFLHFVYNLMVIYVFNYLLIALYLLLTGIVLIAIYQKKCSKLAI